MPFRNPFTLAAIGAMALAGGVVADLDPSCAPGGNFDLSKWDLQLPTSTDGNVDQVKSSELQGCQGYQNYDYFFTESGDGALVMKTPGSNSGCAKTTNSDHCRTEFRESNPSSWDTTASLNRLAVELTGTGGSRVCIGQVFQVYKSSKPYVELYYDSDGSLTAGVEYEESGGSQDMQPVGNVPLNTPFSYELRYENSEMSVGINGEFTTLKTYFQTPGAYFKVGNYNQGDDDSDIHVFNITVSHAD